MKNIKFLFCITFGIYGVIIIIGFALRTGNPGIRLLNNWYVLAGTLALATFLRIGYGIARRINLCQFICRKFNDVQNESPPHYRIEQYILHRWKYQDPIEEISSSVDIINSSGRRSRYSDEEKRCTVEKWESIKQHPNGITLEAFLDHEFGITNGVLNVSKSTFYSWRRKFKNTIKEQKF